jgi:hypothetical protein
MFCSWCRCRVCVCTQRQVGDAVTVPPQAAVLRGALVACTSSHCSMLYTHLAHHCGCLWLAPHSPPAAAGGACASAPRSHPWLGAPGPRHAVTVHRLTHRRAARAGDIACSTHCRELERLPWSSPPAGSACRLNALGSVACRLIELPWGSPRADSACLRHARHSAACRLERTWYSPRDGTVCPRHARRSSACRRLQLP